MNIGDQIAQELKLSPQGVLAAIALLDDGNTIPFIARYRKEATGQLDEVALREISERLEYLRNLEKRREEIRELIDKQGKLTEELAEKLDKATVLQQLEDLYLPYRPKRRTLATMAREKGLEPLATLLFEKRPSPEDAELEAARYINPELGVETTDDALTGACHIIAEQIAEDYQVRSFAREAYHSQAAISSKAKDPLLSSPYETYYDYSEAAAKMPAHRILAINRGEREEFLKVTVEVPQEEIIVGIQKLVGSSLPSYLKAAILDGCQRLLFPAMERELHSTLTQKAQQQAIEVFAGNLKPLLLTPPVKGKTVLAIDPGFRTGCKIAVADSTGKVLATATSYFTPPKRDYFGGKQLILELYHTYKPDVVAIGNGTASRETEEFIAQVIGEENLSLSYTIVSEAGASVYSASDLAREEFPDLDVSIRGAISIGRRLQDPLAELVKVPPQSIGVGQYQHDVDQKRLCETLAAVVEDTVNAVGVDLNTASSALLGYVAGISARVSQNIVAYRNENGPFKNRKELKKVPKLGPATFTQCAGFLRIPGGDNSLDNTAVHPESYKLAQKIVPYLEENLSTSQLKKLSEELEAGFPTVLDIYRALQKPGRDLRDDLPGPVFRREVIKMEDLEPGMILEGIVRNVVDFGAFVDLGVEQDGLLHISQIADRFVRHPADVLSVGQKVEVKILEVDLKRKRISLSRKGLRQMVVNNLSNISGEQT